MKIFELIKSEDDETLWDFSNDVHRAILELYFTKYWDGSKSLTYEKTGESLIEKVNALNPESVLDVGCGLNLFKGKIKNLVGLDPYNSAADINQDLFHYCMSNPDKQHDVIICLGSINFGPRDKILYEVDMLDKLTKSGGYQFWRVNNRTRVGIPELDDYAFDKFPLAQLIDFYEWDRGLVDQIAELYNYELVEYGHEKSSVGNERAYFTFYKY